jgi:hypothetical protein
VVASNIVSNEFPITSDVLCLLSWILLQCMPAYVWVLGCSHKVIMCSVTAST